MNKKGFTLIELLMVVIIIGILVTVAIPGYMNSIERSKASKAKANLDQLRKTCMQIAMITNAVPVGDETVVGPAAVAAGVDFAPDQFTQDAANWTYGVAGATADVAVYTANRVGGQYVGQGLEMDANGNITGIGGAALPAPWAN